MASVDPVHAEVAVIVYESGTLAASCSACGPLHSPTDPETTVLGRVKAHAGLHAAGARGGFTGEEVRRLRRDRDLFHEGREPLGPGSALRYCGHESPDRGDAVFWTCEKPPGHEGWHAAAQGRMGWP